MRVTATHELLAADILARCDASSDVRVVNNKLLGGWYVVRGTSDTPISGKFPSKEAAQQWLIDRKNARNDATNSVKERKLQGIKEEIAVCQRHLEDAIRLKDTEHAKDCREELKLLKEELRRAQTKYDTRDDAAADVVVDSSGKVVQLSSRAKSAGIRMGEKLSSTQLDDLSESGLSVREQK